MDTNKMQIEKKNTQNQPNQFQPINELSRFGHSVTLRKKNYFSNNLYNFSQFKQRCFIWRRKRL
jgi:hypothetical protein